MRSIQRRLRTRASAFAVLILACTAAGLEAQQSPCLTDQPLGDAFIGSLRLQYNDPGIDSTYWHQVGFPFATGDAIQLATKRNVCSAAVSAYNAKTGASVTSVFVALIGDTGYVVMSPPTESGKVTVLYWFDKNWVFRQAMAG